MSKINFNCPKCGSYITILNGNDAKSFIENNKPTPKNSAEAKIEALHKAGVNVANLFSIRNTQGEYEVGRLADGEFTVVPENDPIFAAIKKSGTVPNRRLFRRWVMAQVFHMMTQRDYKARHPMGFTEALNRKGYKYQWKMTVEELRVQAKLNVEDPENFAERNRWFNKSVVVEMAQHYIGLLREIVGELRIRKCKEVPYVRLGGHNIFVADLQNKLYIPLEKQVGNIKKAKTPVALYNATKKFYDEIKKIYFLHTLPQSRDFKDAYKGAGAFFTLKNLILFHECVFPTMNQEASIAYLNYLVKPQEFEGYKLFGVLKEFLIQNNIDIEAKQAEWRK